VDWAVLFGPFMWQPHYFPTFAKPTSGSGTMTEVSNLFPLALVSHNGVVLVFFPFLHVQETNYMLWTGTVELLVLMFSPHY